MPSTAQYLAALLVLALAAAPAHGWVTLRSAAACKAASVDATGAIHACTSQFGDVRLSCGTACRRSEEALVFNQAGPAGAPGLVQDTTLSCPPGELAVGMDVTNGVASLQCEFPGPAPSPAPTTSPTTPSPTASPVARTPEPCIATWTVTSSKVAVGTFPDGSTVAPLFTDESTTDPGFSASTADLSGAAFSAAPLSASQSTLRLKTLTTVPFRFSPAVLEGVGARLYVKDLVYDTGASGQSPQIWNWNRLITATESGFDQTGVSISSPSSPISIYVDNTATAGASGILYWNLTQLTLTAQALFVTQTDSTEFFDVTWTKPGLC